MVQTQTRQQENLVFFAFKVRAVGIEPDEGAEFWGALPK